MRRRLLLITTSVAVLLAGGCGIPDDSDVTVVKTGPSTGVSVVDDPPPPQQTRESTTNPATLANYYLQAAAGDPDTALDRVKEFMSPELAASFRPGSADDVKVVREVKDPLYTPGKTKVELAVQQVGTLSGAGVLTPPAGPTPTTSYTLEIDHIAGKEGLFVLQAPPVLLISDEALAHFYAQRTIYWWNKEYTGLVPDVRYMPLSFPSVQQPTAVLTWLTSGPADWLHDVVQPLPENTAMAENVPAIRDGTLQISLNAPALKPNDGQTLDRLRRQLQWSLRPLEPRTLELTIGRQDPVRFTNAEYLNSNQSYELADVPERFAIYNGVIRRLKGTPRASDPVPVLKNEANKNISAAAMNVSPTHTFAAVITGSGKSQHLRVGAAPLGERADLKVVGGLSGALGRPVWATTPDGDAGNAVGLITADGRLYSFRAAGGAAQRIAWQGAPGQVSAVSVAPDGRRVALVAGGRLYRTVLDYSGDTLAMGAPQQLVPPVPEPSTTSGALRPGFVKVAAVAWSSESYLAVAGDRGDGRYAVTDVTADGALALPNAGLTDIGTSPVTDLTAYPTNPVRGTLSSESYEAGDHAWDVLGDPQPITVEDLVGSFPGAKPGAATTAPFFLG